MKAYLITWKPLEEEGPALFKAGTRSKARYKAYLNIIDCFESCLFGDLIVRRAKQYDNVDFRNGIAPEFVREQQ